LSIRRASVSLVALLLACGPQAAAGPAYPHVNLAGGVRRVRTLTDLEEVRDVAVGVEQTYVATDDGLFVFPADGVAAPTRLGRAEGLPSEDVQAVALEPDGAALVATAGGLVSVRGTTATAVAGVPPSARVTDLVVQPDGRAWLCSLSGLVRRDAGAWARFGDPFQCTTLAPTPEGQLWVGTTGGILFIDGDVVREHPVGGGLPENYVRSIAPVLPGQILALLQGPQRAQLGFWDGTSWYGYVLPEVDEPLAGLVMREGLDATLVTRDRAFSIAPTGVGLAFRPIHAQTGNVRSFRAATTTDATPPAEVDVARALRPSVPFMNGQGNPARAPSLVAVPVPVVLPSGMYRTSQSGPHALLAVGNGGLVELGRREVTRTLRTRTLVPAEDLQLAIETRGGIWVRSRDGDIAKWVDGRLRRLALPDEIAPQAITSGPRGAYLAALTRGTREVRIFASESEGWRPLVQRTLDLPVAGISFMGIAPGGTIWLGLLVERPEGGVRPRGVAVLDPSSETVVYHHREAPQGQGLRMPDEVSAITFDGAGNAWLAALSGAIRVEEFQAIVFDETRGVRGEVVTDVVSGEGRMWIAAAEGLGSYAERQFDFFQPPIVRQHRPLALATDATGHLWAAGALGLLQNDGTAWTHYGVAEGLPTESLRDVEIDGDGRVWLLSEDAVLVLEAP